MIGRYEVLVAEEEADDRCIELEIKFLQEYGHDIAALTPKKREDLVCGFLEKEGIPTDLLPGYAKYISGYEVLDPLINDDDVEEIMVDGYDSPVLIYHRKKGKCETNITLKNENHLKKLIGKIKIFCGIKDGGPIIDCVMPEGCRVNLTLPPVAYGKSFITIRKYLKDMPTIIDLIKNDTLTLQIASFLWVCVDGFGLAPRNIVICGSTSSGKTTLLNALLPLFMERERVVSIEDTLELDAHYCSDWVRLKTSPDTSMEKLVEDSLRLRPDRVIVGEVRGSEAYNLVGAMNLGINGMGTIHANSARDVMLRLKSPPMEVDIKMLGVIDLVVVLTRFYESGASKRKVTYIEEVGDIHNDTIQLGTIFEYDAKAKETKISKFPAITIDEISHSTGLTPKDVLAELSRREIILKYLVEKDITKGDDFVTIVRAYYESPKDVLNEIKKHISTDRIKSQWGQ